MYGKLHLTSRNQRFAVMYVHTLPIHVHTHSLTNSVVKSQVMPHAQDVNPYVHVYVWCI